MAAGEIQARSRFCACSELPAKVWAEICATAAVEVARSPRVVAREIGGALPAAGPERSARISTSMAIRSLRTCAVPERFLRKIWFSRCFMFCAGAPCFSRCGDFLGELLARQFFHVATPRSANSSTVGRKIFARSSGLPMPARVIRAKANYGWSNSYWTRGCNLFAHGSLTAVEHDRKHFRARRRRSPFLNSLAYVARTVSESVRRYGKRDFGICS